MEQTTDTTQTVAERAAADLPQAEVELAQARGEYLVATTERGKARDQIADWTQKRQDAKERQDKFGAEVERLHKLVGLLRRTAGVKAEVSGSEEDEA